MAGLVDISLALYDKQEKAFLIAKGPGRDVPSEEFERRCYISNMAVAHEFRRRGVAKQLIAGIFVQPPKRHGSLHLVYFLSLSTPPPPSPYQTIQRNRPKAVRKYSLLVRQSACASPQGLDI